jgi:hypothetical protein
MGIRPPPTQPVGKVKGVFPVLRMGPATNELSPTMASAPSAIVSILSLPVSRKPSFSINCLLMVVAFESVTPVPGANPDLLSIINLLTVEGKPVPVTCGFAPV